FAVRRRRLVVGLWLAAAALLGTLAATVGGGWSSEPQLPGSESQRALEVLRERFPEASGTSAQVVVHRADGRVDEGAAAAAVDDLVTDLGALPHVRAVLGPTETGLVSGDGSTAIVS